MMILIPLLNPFVKSLMDKGSSTYELDIPKLFSLSDLKDIKSFSSRYLKNTESKELSSLCESCKAACCKSLPINLLHSEYPHYKHKNGLLDTKKGKCVYLKNNKCSIYARRPIVCKMYDCRNDDIFAMTAKPILMAGKPIAKLAKNDLNQSMGEAFALIALMNKDKREFDLVSTLNSFNRMHPEMYNFAQYVKTLSEEERKSVSSKINGELGYE